MIGRRGLNTVERTVLDAVRRELPEELATRFGSRVESINRVQRLTKDKEVNLYHMKRGKPSRDDRHRLLDTDAEEVLLARVSIADGRHHQAEAKVWVVKGHLFSLSFSRSPRDLEGEVQVLDVKLFPPLTLPLPPDYKELSKTTSDASSAQGWAILGPDQIREIVLEDGTYYAVAERPSFGVLAVRESDAESRLYLLLFEDDRVVPCGTTLRDALEYAASAAGEAT